MIRIFPHYKGKYIGKSKNGYANISRAKSTNNLNLTEDMILEFFGHTRRSWREKHGVVFNIDTKHSIADTWIFPKGVKVYNRSYTEYVNISELSQDILDELDYLDYHKYYGFVNPMPMDFRERFIKFQNKTGLYPDIFRVSSILFDIEKKKEFIENAIEWKKIELPNM